MGVGVGLDLYHGGRSGLRLISFGLGLRLRNVRVRVGCDRHC